MKKKADTPILSFTDVDFSYEKNLPHVLRDISFSLAPHTITAIVGASGSGKSTILRLAAGLLKPSEGEVVSDAMTRMVFQNSALLPWQTARENVLFGLLASDHSKTSKEKRVASALNALGMKKLAHMYPRDLSGGERQRVGIARAIVDDPELLLLDEPFSALDILTTEKLSTLLQDIFAKKKMTMLMVSHSIENAVFLADRILVVKHGKIAEDITVPFPRPRTTLTDEMLSLVKKIEL